MPYTLMTTQLTQVWPETRLPPSRQFRNRAREHSRVPAFERLFAAGLEDEPVHKLRDSSRVGNLLPTRTPLRIHLSGSQRIELASHNQHCSAPQGVNWLHFSALRNFLFQVFSSGNSLHTLLIFECKAEHHLGNPVGREMSVRYYFECPVFRDRRPVKTMHRPQSRRQVV